MLTGIRWTEGPGALESCASTDGKVGAESYLSAAGASDIGCWWPKKFKSWEKVLIPWGPKNTDFDIKILTSGNP